MNVRYHPVHYNEMICSIGSLRIYFIVYRISEYVSLPVRMYRPVSYICLKHNCRIRSMYVYLIIHLSLQPITWYYMSVANRSLHLSEWMVGRIYVSTIRCTSSWFIYYFNLLNDMYLPTHVSLLVQKNELVLRLEIVVHICPNELLFETPTQWSNQSYFKSVRCSANCSILDAGCICLLV